MFTKGQRVPSRNRKQSKKHTQPTITRRKCQKNYLFLFKKLKSTSPLFAAWREGKESSFKVWIGFI